MGTLSGPCTTIEGYLVNYVEDKYPVLLLSSCALPIGLPSMLPAPEVPCRSGIVRHQIPMPSILMEYTAYMWGVNVANQLRSLYNAQTRSHKRWHKIFNGLHDITIVNIYIMYLDRC